jgi:DNA-binding helix-hairpin-helix protein with protein kinase domain
MGEQVEDVHAEGAAILSTLSMLSELVISEQVRFRPGAAVRPNRRPAIQRIMAYHKETAMNEEELNVGIRKFLKMVGVNSQREIEHSIARAVQEAAILGTETFSPPG